MATLESAITVFAPQRFSNNYHFLAKSPDSVKFHSSSSSLFSHNHKLHFSSSSSSSSSNSRILCFALNNVNKRLRVFNLPWSQSAQDIKDLFSQCGTVISAEIPKSKEGKGKGCAFVTMGTGEEAQAVVDKFNGHEISGQIVRIEIAKRLRTPPPPPPGSPSDARHVIYVSHLAWKARSTHLRDIFTENFKEPVSAKVAFQSANRRPGGYGFVSYHTKEEAEAAVSALEGKELMGRPLRVKISEKKVKKAESEEGEEQIAAIEEVKSKLLQVKKVKSKLLNVVKVKSKLLQVKKVEQIAESGEGEEQIAESGEGDEKQVDNKSNSFTDIWTQ